MDAELENSSDSIRDLQSRVDSVMSQIQVDLDNILRQRDEEIENLRRNSARSVEDMQQQQHAELKTKFKSELSHLKKKYESEHRDLITQMANLSRSDADLVKANKSLDSKLKETESNVEMERSAAQEARERSMVLERELIVAQTELHDARSLFNNVTQELTANLSEIKIGVDKYNDYMSHAKELESLRKKAESQRDDLEVLVRKLTVQVEEVEDAMKSIAELRALEAELDLEQRRARDATAENEKLQKQPADLRAQVGDDHDGSDRAKK